MLHQGHEPLRSSKSEAVTHNVRVEVSARYAPEQSLPFLSQWAFFYTVRITNERDETVQLLSRHWVIADEAGHVREVKGEGVVGEQPVLGPGETFQYTSGCELATSSGVMRGTYQMLSVDGAQFDVEIAPFALHEPYTIH
jgi:ApaG protein